MAQHFLLTLCENKSIAFNSWLSSVAVSITACSYCALLFTHLLNIFEMPIWALCSFLFPSVIIQSLSLSRHLFWSLCSNSDSLWNVIFSLLLLLCIFCPQKVQWNHFTWFFIWLYPSYSCLCPLLLNLTHYTTFIRVSYEWICLIIFKALERFLPADSLQPAFIFSSRKCFLLRTRKKLPHKLYSFSLSNF